MTTPSNGRRPAAPAAERALLGGILLDGESFVDAVDKVDAADFAIPEHRAAWAAAETIYGRGEPVTLPAIAALTGADALLFELQAESASAANVPHHARLVRKTACRRRLQDIGARLQKQAAEGDLEELADGTISDLLALTGEGAPQDMAPLSIAAPEAFRQIERAYQGKAPRMGTTTGFPALDAILGGLRPGQIVVLGARPSVGKTALACSIATAAAASGPVLFVSAEMSKEELTLRFLAGASGLDLRRLPQGRLQREEWPILADAAGKVAALDVRIVDRSAVRPATVRAACQRTRPRPVLVIVDYLQLMTAGGHHENRNLEIGAITRDLKIMARDFGTPVLLLSQLSRKIEERGADAVPRLSDLRDSGSIEQDADAVLFLYRKGGVHLLDVAKQRNGPLGGFTMRWDARSATFRSAEPRDEQ